MNGAAPNGPLLPGSRFPSIEALDLSGQRVDIATVIAGAWSAVLFYRGHW